ncbi:transposase [Simiduia aestuariiviva]|uniref:Putative transposase n=1 Tax=Simiduia aestuariiviva TaxID=1510459 RepID=A0A839UGK2_9GAMM|nr:transposase [Simiduia aestuariiviva]MBB3167174.1 putative transposase [Simiduia aestuariiviva]
MARLPRLYFPGCAQHVIQRGNNRSACFFDESDYKAYLSFLKEAAEKYSVAIHAFVLMTNHVHLLVTPADAEGVSRMMQSLGRKYVQYVNFTYRRTGTLWEGRYKSTLVDANHYLLTVYRYIELNPVRAAMVDHAANYPWSSFQGNGLGKPVQLLTPHALYQQLGATEDTRQRAYRALFRGRMAERDLTDIRTAINSAWVLGNDRFKAQIEAHLGRRVEPKARGGDRKSEAFRESRGQ